MIERDAKGHFLPGNKASGGHRAGCKDKLTRCVKTAILMAAESVGEDGRGRNGLVGYLRRVALKDEKTFCLLLAKLVPLEVHSKSEEPVTCRSVEEVQDELAARGIDADYLALMAENMAKRAKANGGGDGVLHGDGNLN